MVYEKQDPEYNNKRDGWRSVNVMDDSRKSAAVVWRYHKEEGKQRLKKSKRIISGRTKIKKR